MNVKDEVFLAVEMGIESALDFVYISKLNYWNGYHNDYYLGIFNGKIRRISCVESYWKWHMFVEDENGFPIRPLKDWNHKQVMGNWTKSQWNWDEEAGQLIPDKYWKDEDFRLRYDKKAAVRAVNWYTEKTVFDDKNRDYWLMGLEEANERLSKLEKKINYRKHIKEIIESGGEIDRSKDFDIPYLKTIPISDFVEINRAGFFRVRDEDKTPSCKWYKEDNTWVDFGGGNQKHDVIDLIMILKGFNFVEACRFLSFK
jgi:hypothetical protein